MSLRVGNKVTNLARVCYARRVAVKETIRFN